MLEHLRAAIPDAEAVLALEPEELAGKLLFILRQHGGNMFNFGNMEAELTVRLCPVLSCTGRALSNCGARRWR